MIINIQLHHRAFIIAYNLNANWLTLTFLCAPSTEQEICLLTFIQFASHML